MLTKEAAVFICLHGLCCMLNCTCGQWSTDVWNFEVSDTTADAMKYQLPVPRMLLHLLHFNRQTTNTY